MDDLEFVIFTVGDLELGRRKLIAAIRELEQQVAELTPAPDEDDPE